MEHWIIHYNRHYDAVPWPFPISWDDFVRAPLPLVHPCTDFGRVAPCDGLSETPTVPPHLPRHHPRGQYRFAIYHDADWLYALLDAENGPAVVAPDRLNAIPHLAGIAHCIPSLLVLTPDQQYLYRFTLDSRGHPSASVTTILYGHRANPPPTPAIRWDFQMRPTPNGELSCWRIHRAALADAFLGQTLLLSVARLHLPSLETVAWGAAPLWGPRPDEFATVRLVPQRQHPPPWPVARRVEITYDPGAEQAKFSVIWDGIYQPAESNAVVYPDPALRVPWQQWSLHLNGTQHLFDLREHTTTRPLPLADGHNRIAIAHAGGPAISITLEKHSGQRIQSRPAPPHTARTRDWLIDQARAEAAACLPPNSSATNSYRPWAMYQAASCGRFFHYLDPDPRWLELLRREADHALTFQRPDGSFAGYHLARHGRPPAPWAGGAYDSGLAGELWVIAAWLLRDEKYLTASHRLVQAYSDYRIELNYNYAAFALFHLVAHYRLTQEPLALEHALYYSRHCIAVDQLPLGFHAGHNYYTCYSSIILRALSHLCAILPPPDPYRAELRERCLRMTNQLLARQQPDGSFDACDRFFLGQRCWPTGLFSVPFLLSPADAAQLDAAIQHLLHSPTPSQTLGNTARYAESDLIRYIAHRDLLLTGQPINLHTLI